VADLSTILWQYEIYFRGIVYSANFFDSSKYILVIFLFNKSKKEPLSYIKYMWFNTIHLKVYNTLIVCTLVKQRF
jgi:hypothetical protein